MREQDLGLRTRETFISTSKPDFDRLRYGPRGTIYAFSSGSRQKILERDGYKCVVCGKTDCLEAAHKNHNRDNPNYNNPANGKTLCVEHHLEDHIKNAGHNGLSRRANDWAIDKLKERLNGG